MRQRGFFCGCLLLLIAGTLLGAAAPKDQPAEPPNYANGVTLEFDVTPLPGGPAAGQALTDETVKQLRQRLDPDGSGKVRVRATSPTRLKVWMDYPKACQKLWRDMQKAAADFGPTTSPANGAPAENAVSKQHLEYLLSWGTAKQCADFLAAHPDKEDAIKSYTSARHQLIVARGDAIRDPDELARLVLARGDLAFRIAVTPAELNAAGQIGTDAAELSLKNHGPALALKVGGLNAKWYPVDAASQISPVSGNAVLCGTDPTYMLCYDDPKASMTHDRGPAWKISPGNVNVDPHTIRISLPFHLDKSGGSLMGNLSRSHLRSALAIVLDDQVLEAPVLQAPITQDGEITMGTTNPPTQRRDAERMRSLLNTRRSNALLKQVGKTRVGT